MSVIQITIVYKSLLNVSYFCALNLHRKNVNIISVASHLFIIDHAMGPISG